MSFDLKNKEVTDFVFYLWQQEEKWKHQESTLKIIKYCAQNMLIGMEDSSTGKFLSHEELQDRIKGTFNCILESIDGLKKMEGIPRETNS